MKTLFTASQFTATKWDSAEDKAKFANHFIRFLESGFKRELFTHDFYRRLSLCFGHIAHYDINGFYETFFADPSDWKIFIDVTLQHPCYGDPGFTCSDVERAIQAYLQNHAEFMALILTQSNSYEKTKDITQAKALLAKHGIAFDFEVKGGT